MTKKTYVSKGGAMTRDKVLLGRNGAPIEIRSYVQTPLSNLSYFGLFEKTSKTNLNFTHFYFLLFKQEEMIEYLPFPSPYIP